MAVVVALAVALLLVRDHLTLRAEMSKKGLRCAIERNSARTVRWSHVLFLVAATVALFLSARNPKHQVSWQILAEMAVVAIIVSKYDRDRSEAALSRAIGSWTQGRRQKLA